MDGARRRRRGFSPPILTLLDLFEEHKAAFEYDWRTRFGLPLYEVGESMSYGEAWRLTDLLRADPSSQLASTLAGWEHPASRESMALMDLYDLQHASKSRKKPKPYPRPWGDKDRKRFGKTDMTREQVIAVLSRFGHSMGKPTRRRDARGRFVA